MIPAPVGEADNCIDSPEQATPPPEAWIDALGPAGAIVTATADEEVPAQPSADLATTV